MGAALKTLSGKEMVRILASFRFVVQSARGSHVKLRRVVAGANETLVIPDHNPLAKGTLRAIFNQASKYIPQSELRPHFYRE